MSKRLFRKALVVAILTTSTLPIFADEGAPEPPPEVTSGSTTAQMIIDQIMIIFS
jgi:hypothetical protein